MAEATCNSEVIMLANYTYELQEKPAYTISTTGLLREHEKLKHRIQCDLFTRSPCKRIGSQHLLVCRAIDHPAVLHDINKPNQSPQQAKTRI